MQADIGYRITIFFTPTVTIYSKGRKGLKLHKAVVYQTQIGKLSVFTKLNATGIVSLIAKQSFNFITHVNYNRLTQVWQYQMYISHVMDEIKELNKA